jgi:hypothetical protein
VPQPQESQPDIQQEASPEEEPLEIELVIPESPTAHDSPAEEQQQPEDQDTEDKTNEEHPPLSDTNEDTDYADFQHMVDMAIVIENKIKEMEKDGKRKLSFSGQSSGSNVRSRFS